MSEEPDEHTDETAAPEDDAEGPKTQGDGAGPARREPAAPSKRRMLAMKIGRVLLAPLLAGAAVGVHFALNVPEHKVEANKRDQGNKAKKKAKRARARKRNKHQPRAGQELDRLAEHFAQTEFDLEPVVGKWARLTQTLLNKAVVMARKAAFEGAPEEPRVIVTRIQCRTIRCRFLLRSPYPHEVELLASTLRGLETGGENIWRVFETETVDPPTPDSPKEDHYLQVTVSLIADDIDGGAVELGDPVKGEGGGKSGAKEPKPKEPKPKEPTP